MNPCPKCHSTDCKKASLVYAEGSQSTVGVGIGLSGHMGVGVSSTKTDLARKHAPPILAEGFSANSVFNIFLVSIAIAIVNAIFGGSYPTWFVETIIVLVAWDRIYKNWRKKAIEAHQVATENYNSTFVCMRCGEAYLPFAMPQKQSVGATPTGNTEQHPNARRNAIVATFLAIPIIGWFGLMLLTFAVPIAILLKSKRRIHDLALFFVFLATYIIATAVFSALLGDKWMLAGIPLWPLSFYASQLFEKRLPAVF